jgi:hypothetical protein
LQIFFAKILLYHLALSQRVQEQIFLLLYKEEYADRREVVLIYLKEAMQAVTTMY